MVYRAKGGTIAEMAAHDFQFVGPLPKKLSRPFTHWSVRKLAAYLALTATTDESRSAANAYV